MFLNGGNMMIKTNNLTKVNTLADAVCLYCELDIFNLANNESLEIDVQNIVNDIEEDMDVLTENLDMSNLDKYVFYEDKFIEDMNLFISSMM